jgi:hypothetical protein
MKIKIFTLATLAIITLGVMSCKKLTNNNIAVNSSAISATFKSGLVSKEDIVNKKNDIARFVDLNINIDSSLQVGVAIADSNGFVATKTDILDGKIKSVSIKNANSSDTRSFYDYYSNIEKIYVKFTKDEVLPNEEISESNGYNELCGKYDLTETDINKLVIAIPDSSQKSLKNFLNGATPAADERTNMIVIIKGTCKLPIEKDNEFYLKVDAITTLNLAQKAK